MEKSPYGENVFCGLQISWPLTYKGSLRAWGSICTSFSSIWTGSLLGDPVSPSPYFLGEGTWLGPLDPPLYHRSYCEEQWCLSYKTTPKSARVFIALQENKQTNKHVVLFSQHIDTNNRLWWWGFFFFFVSFLLFFFFFKLSILAESATTVLIMIYQQQLAIDKSEYMMQLSSIYPKQTRGPK